MVKILDIVKKEERRQKKTLNLIASENYVSRNVLKALGSSFTNKYAEGRSHERYYFGTELADEMEDEVKRLVYKVFKISPSVYDVNVQPYSGSIANLAVYLGTLDRGDKIISMSLDQGGHLTHGYPVSYTGKLFNFKHYGVNDKGAIDYDEMEKIAGEFKPKMIIAGASAYPRKIDFKKFKPVADSVGAILTADISHIAGLVVGGAHSSPFPYADVVTTTTHKTLRGSRGAIIISKKSLSRKIDQALFPGLQGGPHLHSIAAIGVALEEALRPEFKLYAKQIVKNAQALAVELKRLGFTLVYGGTENHLMMIDVTSLGMGGKEAGERLEKMGIIVNKNTIPHDTRKPWDPSGIRLGTAAVTTQGMKESDMKKIAQKIAKVLMR